MIKKFLIKTKIVTASKDVIENTLDFLSVDVDECSMTESEIIEDIDVNEIDKLRAISPIETNGVSDVEWLCPKCKTKVGSIVNVDNYCRNCGQKILFN